MRREPTSLKSKQNEDEIVMGNVIPLRARIKQLEEELFQYQKKEVIAILEGVSIRRPRSWKRYL